MDAHDEPRPATLRAAYACSSWLVLRGTRHTTPGEVLLSKQTSQGMQLTSLVSASCRLMRICLPSPPPSPPPASPPAAPGGSLAASAAREEQALARALLLNALPLHHHQGPPGAAMVLRDGRPRGAATNRCT